MTRPLRVLIIDDDIPGQEYYEDTWCAALQFGDIAPKIEYVHSVNSKENLEKHLGERPHIVIFDNAFAERPGSEKIDVNVGIELIAKYKKKFSDTVFI